MSTDQPIWTPSPERAAASGMQRLLIDLAARGVLPSSVTDSHALWHWSVDHPEQFWEAVWQDTRVIAERQATGRMYDAVLVGGERMAPPDPALGPHWFPSARLNFAENLLRRRDDHTALVSWTERGRERALTFHELAREVFSCQLALRAQGVQPGDRVAGWLPNVIEAVVAMLATTSLGAIWTSVSPDFGTAGVLDRLGQTAPRVLIVADQYQYAGREIDVMPRVRDVAAQLPSLRAVWVVSSAADRPSISALPGGAYFNDVVSEQHPQDESLTFARLPFDHPLYVLYSSGTTGLPKCIVHGAGGTLLQHVKEHRYHTDLSERDTLFYFTTCGWMMWNWMVSALASGTTIVLYDGAPLPAAEPGLLWRMAAEERVTVFGTSAKYLSALEKSGVVPREAHELSALRTVLSTGSPLAEHSYDFVYRAIGDDIQLASISGGTDIVSCFALGDPTSPVYRGELQMRGLGMAVDIRDDDGASVRGSPGELVCTRPFPSMPVAFWNDPDGTAYRAAYFSHTPGVWRHGDWAEITAHNGLIIHGRSDATLNPGGVRIGTAEIYRQVDVMEEIAESVVTEYSETGRAGTDARIVLFVRMQDNHECTDALRATIRRRLRETTSPHHVPAAIIAVPDIPRTRSGKISELAVREALHDRPVKNAEALANAESLALFRGLQLSDHFRRK